MLDVRFAPPVAGLYVADLTLWTNAPGIAGHRATIMGRKTSCSRNRIRVSTIWRL